MLPDNPLKIVIVTAIAVFIVSTFRTNTIVKTIVGQ